MFRSFCLIVIIYWKYLNLDIFLTFDEENNSLNENTESLLSIYTRTMWVSLLLIFSASSPHCSPSFFRNSDFNAAFLIIICNHTKGSHIKNIIQKSAQQDFFFVHYKKFKMTGKLRKYYLVRSSVFRLIWLIKYFTGKSIKFACTCTTIHTIIYIHFLSHPIGRKHDFNHQQVI